MALDIVGPLLETNNGNKYIFVSIDHYSKWVEAKVIADHETKTTTRFWKMKSSVGLVCPSMF